MKRSDSYRRVAAARREQAQKLRTIANQLVAGGDDPLDDLGLLRLAEIQIEPTRKAIVKEAKTDGFDWQQIGDILCISAEDAELLYGNKES